ncbi:hypothetical protein C3B61_14735 [Cryobacterium zongtaii]|uniref:Large polyvalent protein associated domain-containing protein n=1 Tax=Cryobacterium zongtaii TaxID=1259217 RepID=A0A2S3ZBE0_9MICO|nr:MULTISPECIES: LPD29 domain-containing protein [Cryobacterium]ASD24230.1 hypothetical protein B7495_18275 [Cryobacterium sp. LW097]POH62937.1 hypothetical protein C3B61_14735 [Cryobacterium zongtaii]TFC57876.1 hypothetical protein E3O68_02350 [Cryobacterium sp. TMB3-1-2]TFC63265.1 hypothetical protein E3O60_00235 [Cryobacterium sp. TMB1-7]TFC75372.1 hypothetical protein E3T21_00075 [Cryobacterium sp. TMB3-15]
MIEYITTKDTAKLVRAALKNAFPGVKFSVRMSTGTAAAWMNVSYSDGPTELEVKEVTSQFQGRSFNGMTDSYDDSGTALIAGEGEEMPREVRYCCDGILSHREYTAAGYRAAQHLIRTESDHRDLVLFTPEGEPIDSATLPDGLYVAGRYLDYLYSPKQVAQAILHRVNLCTVTTPVR